MNFTDEIFKIGLTPDQYEECVELILNKKRGVTDIDWQEICDKYNLPYSADTLRKASSTVFGGVFIADYFREKTNDIRQSSVEDMQKNYGTEIAFNKDGTRSSSRLLVMTESESKNPQFILKAHGFNAECWQIVSARNSIRQVISKQDGVITLYASYLTVKPIDDSIWSYERIESFFNKLDREYSLPVLKENYSYLSGNKMLLIDIADLHMNLQSSVFSSGNEYNCDIAEQLFFHVINDILTRTKIFKFKEIVFCIGGDMLNGDNLFGSTTKGTPQDSDIHYYDAYEKLCAMIVKAIDLLKDICKVSIIYIMGNHDEVSGFKLAKFIDAWFRNEPNVSVDYQPIARKYKLFGKTLLCFAHDGKVQKLPAIIANEARSYWSQAETTEVFLQHLHTEQVLVEDNNIRIQRLPTISGRSKWSADKGYGSKRQCKSFIFDENDGLTDVLYTPIRKFNIKSNLKG